MINISGGSPGDLVTILVVAIIKFSYQYESVSK